MKIKNMFAALALLGSLGSAYAQPFTLNLEGITIAYPNEESALISGFYSGGTSSEGTSGVNYGVDFVGDVLTTCLNSATVFCAEASKAGAGVPGSERTGMFVGFGGGLLNVAAGFDTAFSFAYTKPLPFIDATVNVYSGLDGTGDLLASLLLETTSDLDLVCEPYQAGSCPFYNAAIDFAGTARSVTFDGIGGFAVYDDLTFGSAVVGAGSDEVPPAEVPEPSGLALLAAAGVLGALARRHKQA